MEGRLQGRVVVVTGGCGDIGRATAAACAREGAKVILVDLLAPSEARAALGAADADAFVYIPCDVRDRAAVRDMIAAVESRYGGPDVAIANAGITRSTPGVIPRSSIAHLRKAARTPPESGMPRVRSRTNMSTIGSRRSGRRPGPPCRCWPHSPGARAFSRHALTRPRWCIRSGCRSRIRREPSRQSSFAGTRGAAGWRSRRS